MHESIIQYFNSFLKAPLTADQIDIVKGAFIPKKFRKRQYFLQEGEVCEYMAFIAKGAMRQYSVDKKGEEHVIKLFVENWWAGDRESCLKGIPSSYFIDAWEDTEVLLITKASMLSLLTRVPPVSECFRTLDGNFGIAAQRRLNAAISLSAEERLHDLEKTYPEFLQRFPQHIIASYLGINRETLSRIRARNAKK